MKNVGLIILFVGFFIGVLMLLQLESLRVTMLPEKSNESIENPSGDLYEKSVAKYSSDMMEITRLLYIPLLMMLLGGLLAMKQRPPDKSLRKHLQKRSHLVEDRPYKKE